MIEDESAISDDEILKHVVLKTIGFKEETLSATKDWLLYKNIGHIHEIVLKYCHEPARFESHGKYRRSGGDNELAQGTVSKPKLLVLWSEEIMIHHDMVHPKVSYVNLEKPEFDNWHVNHVEPLPWYGI